MENEKDYTSLFLLDSKNRVLPQPFDPNEAGSQFYLVLFGAGFRGVRGGISATIGGPPVTVASAGAQGEFVGLDQINLGPLPNSLAGKLGEVEASVTVDGALSNPVTVAPTLPMAAQWGARANLLEANSEMSVAELNGKIYVLGGYPPSRVTVATVQAYDPAANTWSLAAPMPAPVNHSMPAVVNGKLYIIGGQSDSGSTSFVNTVFEYDPFTNTWVSLAPMPIAVHGVTGAAFLNGLIYLPGGGTAQGGSSGGTQHQVYRPRVSCR